VRSCASANRAHALTPAHAAAQGHRAQRIDPEAHTKLQHELEGLQNRVKELEAAANESRAQLASASEEREAAKQELAAKTAELAKSKETVREPRIHAPTPGTRLIRARWRVVAGDRASW